MSVQQNYSTDRQPGVRKKRNPERRKKAAIQGLRKTDVSRCRSPERSLKGDRLWPRRREITQRPPGCQLGAVRSAKPIGCHHNGGRDGTTALSLSEHRRSRSTSGSKANSIPAAHPRQAGPGAMPAMRRTPRMAGGRRAIAARLGLMTSGQRSGRSDHRTLHPDAVERAPHHARRLGLLGESADIGQRCRLALGHGDRHERAQKRTRQERASRVTFAAIWVSDSRDKAMASALPDATSPSARAADFHVGHGDVLQARPAAARVVAVFSTPTTRKPGWSTSARLWIAEPARHQEGALQHDVRRPEVDLLLALVVDRQERHVPGAGWRQHRSARRNWDTAPIAPAHRASSPVPGRGRRRRRAARRSRRSPHCPRRGWRDRNADPELAGRSQFLEHRRIRKRRCR